MMNDGEITGLAYYLVWHNIVTKDSAGVWVNISISRDTEWVVVNSHMPYEGRVEIEVRDAPVLFVGVADWADKAQVALSVNRRTVDKSWNGDYLRIESLKSGDIVEVNYLLRRLTQTQFVGGWYDVQWIGDTVVAVDSTNSTLQYSSPMYGLLYQRGAFSGKAPARNEASSSTRQSVPEISFPL